MEPGRRWNGQRLEYREEWRKEDLEKGESSDRRMMREVLKLANSLEADIQLTLDIPSDHTDMKIPVLDVKVWVEKVQ